MTVVTTPLPSRWSATNEQMSVSVRMEPAAPVAGQPVTFTVTVAPGVGCCLGATIAFGDEDDARDPPGGPLRPRLAGLRQPELGQRRQGAHLCRARPLPGHRPGHRSGVPARTGCERGGDGQVGRGRHPHVRGSGARFGGSGMRTVTLAGRAGWVVRALVGSLAILLPAGVWASTAVDRRPGTQSWPAAGQGRRLRRRRAPRRGAAGAGPGGHRPIDRHVDHQGAAPRRPPRRRPPRPRSRRSSRPFRGRPAPPPISRHS